MRMYNDGGRLTEVGHGAYGRVDRELLIIDTKPVTVCVGVREETGLEDGICGCFEAGNKV